MVRGHQELPAGLREGDIVAGKYRIDRVIGAGAMGTVVAARHVLLEEKVAIKFLRPEALGHAEAVPRFVREARASVRIKSEHVVRVLDVDVLQEPRVPYIVMELLEGADLAEGLEQHGPLPVGQAVDFVLQACEAIAEAHRLGIIHRDLKPANLFRVRRGDREDCIKVLDFGISKLSELTSTVGGSATSEDGRLITADRVMMGSPLYMSPEQMESARDVDERTDVWALGVTLCELVTGKLPFAGQSLVHVYFSIASDKPLQLHDWSPALPRGLKSAILRCLERDREKRFRSVNALAQAIAEFGPRSSSAYLHRMKAGAEGELSLAETVGLTASVVPGGQTLPSAGHSEPSAEPRRAHRAAWIVGACVTVPILAFILGTGRYRGELPPASEAPPRTVSGASPSVSVPVAKPEAAGPTLAASAPFTSSSSSPTTIATPEATASGKGLVVAPASRAANTAGLPNRGVPAVTSAGRPSVPRPAPAESAVSVHLKPSVAEPATSSSASSPPPTTSGSLLDRMLQRQE